MSTAALTTVAGGHASWRDVVVLLKLRIDALIVAVAVAAALAAGERSLLRLGLLAGATLAAAAGAGSLNHVFDRELDRRMQRTRDRPVASGRVDPSAALTLGLGLIGLSLLAWPVLGPLVTTYLLAGALTYAVVYTLWLKPRTPYSIVWGGAAGSFAALAGWQTAGSTLAPAPLVLAMVLFLWTPSHFWSLALALEDDYRASGLPMLSVVAGPARTARAVSLNTLALSAFALLECALVPWPYAVAAVPATLWFSARASSLARDPGRERAWSLFKLSGLYLLLLLIGLSLTPLA